MDTRSFLVCCRLVYIFFDGFGPEFLIDAAELHKLMAEPCLDSLVPIRGRGPKLSDEFIGGLFSFSLVCL